MRRHLLDRVEEVTDVTVHIDPEDDEQESPCYRLPLRSKVIKKLKHHWAEAGLDDIAAGQITLHYLGGRLQIDLLLPLSVLDEHQDARTFIRGIERAAKALPEVDSVRISFHV